MKSKLNQILSNLNQRRCRKEPEMEFEDECIEKKDKEQNVSPQYLEIQKS